MISNIYNLNFMHYSSQDQRRSYIEMDLDPSDPFLEEIENMRKKIYVSKNSTIAIAADISSHK